MEYEMLENHCIVGFTRMAGSNQATGHGPKSETDLSVNVTDDDVTREFVLTTNTNPSFTDMAGSKTLTGHRERSEIEQRLLWLDLSSTAVPESLTPSAIASGASALIQALDLLSMTPAVGSEDVTHVNRSLGLGNAGLAKSVMDLRVNAATPDLCVVTQTVDTPDSQIFAMAEHDSAVIDFQDTVQECDSLNDQTVACFFNNLNSSNSSGCNCSSCRCSNFCKSDNESNQGTSVQYVRKPKKRVTFGPNEIQYFGKNMVIDVNLYLERKMLKNKSLKNRKSNKQRQGKTSRKLAQIKATLVRPFTGLGVRLRKFFTDGNENVL